MKYSFDKEEHVHKLDNKPLTGTSSVMNVISKPLTYWASGKAVELFGWVNPRYASEERCKEVASKKFNEIKQLDDSGYLKLLNKAYRNFNDVTKKAATAGTELHAFLEDYVKECLNKNDGKPIPIKNLGKPDRIDPFINWAVDNVEKFLWSEAHCYNEEMWVGGISDCGAKLKNGEIAIVDFKSSKEAYLSQFIQIAGYASQIEANGWFTSDGTPIGKLDGLVKQYIIFPFGAEEIKAEVKHDVEELQKAFVAALVLYRLLNSYEKS